MNFLQTMPIIFWVFEVIIWSLLIGIPVYAYSIYEKPGSPYERRAQRARNGVLVPPIFLISLLSIIWLCVLWGRFVEPYRLVVNEFQIENPNFPPTRVVVVADFHLGLIKKDAWVAKVVKQINELEPEVVVIPGDFLTGTAEKFADFLAPLKEINAPVYFTLGNHDYEMNNRLRGEGITYLRERLQAFELVELKNSADFFDNKFWIAGVEDNYLGFDNLAQALAAVPADDPKLLLAHSPDIVDEYFDPSTLIISGHTHCGQIRFPFIGAVPGTIPTKNGGKFSKHWYPDQNLFVTCGVGESGPVARFLNPPEVVVLNIN